MSKQSNQKYRKEKEKRLNTSNEQMNAKDSAKNNTGMEKESGTESSYFHSNL